MSCDVVASMSNAVKNVYTLVKSPTSVLWVLVRLLRLSGVNSGGVLGGLGLMQHEVD